MLEDAEAKTVFTLGGTVKLDSAVALRLDRPGGGIGKVSFGATVTDESSNSPAVDFLISSCETDSFGLAGKDIFDKQYRNALKLDPTQFSINFHPADHAILDEIGKVFVMKCSQ